jgi:hypothetical protein
VTALAFLDLETVTLDPGPDVIWEIGVIARDDGKPDQEWLFQLRPNMDKATDEALEVSRFHDRFRLGQRGQVLGWSPTVLGFEPFPPAQMTYGAVATLLAALLQGRHVFGSCPSFDTVRLSLFLRKHLPAEGYRDPWHYQPHDVEDLAVGYLAAQRREYPGSKAADFDPAPPWDSDELTKALGLDPVSDDDRHTALGDARWARAIYDHIMATSGEGPPR